MYLLKERPEEEKEEPLVPAGDDDEKEGLNEGEDGAGGEAETEAALKP